MLLTPKSATDLSSKRLQGGAVRGHIRRRGEAWELRVYAGVDPLTNRQKYITRTFRGTKREAEEALARLVIEVSGGSQAAQDTTVGDLIREWLALATPELSPTTARGYEWITRTYLLPTLGNIKLARLKTSQLDRLYVKLRESGGQGGTPLSAATVRQAHAIIRRALHQAVRWGWISTNPAAMASPPRVHSKHPDLPSPKDVVHLIEAATAEDPDFGCFLLLAATTGARRGELCGLQWRDLDLDDRTMTISRAVVEAAHSEVVVKDTKTHASRRIALDERTADALAEQRARCQERCRMCGTSLRESAFVFSPDADCGRPLAPNDATKIYIRIRKKVGMDHVRLHDLRHFAATRLLAAGVSVRTVSGRLGHANAATTLGVYAHFVEESDREAAEKLGALLEEDDGGGRRAKPIDSRDSA
jgi:integrase